MRGDAQVLEDVLGTKPLFFRMGGSIPAVRCTSLLRSYIWMAACQHIQTCRLITGHISMLLMTQRSTVTQLTALHV